MAGVRPTTINSERVNCIRVREFELFSAAIKMSLDGIIIGDLNGFITDVNDAIIKMYGAADKNEFVGKHVIDFLVESDRERALNDSLDILKNRSG